MRKTTIVTILYGVIQLCLTHAPVGADNLVEQLKTSGHALLIRHAYAPGTGDPENFTLGDCATQRNLNAQGRNQASQIGRWLRARGIETAKIYSSQWCRCLETARLLDLGPVSELSALNSFFDRPQDREPNLAALKVFLSSRSTASELLVLVTHFVTIDGITGQQVDSGEGVVVRLNGEKGLNVLGRLDFDF